MLCITWSTRSAHQFAVLALALSLAPALHAGSHDLAVIDSQSMSNLEARAVIANPREQCFLYTELVSGMTELAGKQLLDGDVEQASQSIKRIEHYTSLIHMGLARDTRRVKNAEMLMHHTTYRLNEILHKSSGEDRAVLQSTLQKLNSIQEELLTQVFLH